LPVMSVEQAAIARGGAIPTSVPAASVTMEVVVKSPRRHAVRPCMETPELMIWAFADGTAVSPDPENGEPSGGGLFVLIYCEMTMCRRKYPAFLLCCVRIDTNPARLTMRRMK